LETSFRLAQCQQVSAVRAAWGDDWGVNRGKVTGAESKPSMIPVLNSFRSCAVCKNTRIEP